MPTRCCTGSESSSPSRRPGAAVVLVTTPAYADILYAALVSVYTSTRKVETEFSHPANWANLRRLVRRRFPDDPSKHLPERPMRRHHFVYTGPLSHRRDHWG